MAYIDQDVALEALGKACDRLCPYPEKKRAIMCGYCGRGDAIHVIEGLAAADVRENAAGEWVTRRDGYYQCSQCGEMCTWGSNFCPSCGARMKLLPIFTIS